MKKIYLFSFIVPVFMLTLVDVVLAREAQLYGMTQWTSTCSGGTRNAWDNMGDAWYNEITDPGFELLGLCLWGHCSDSFSKDRRKVNGTWDADLLMEQQLFAPGQDRTYIDEGDAIMIFTHGADLSNYWGGLMRFKDSNNDCFINAEDELRVGDYDAEYLHLSSCNSLDDNQISNAYNIFGNPSTQRRLHLVTGFHGCMWIGNSFINDYKDFADDAFNMSIGLAWMHNMYRTGINGSNTQCPVAYAVGSNVSDCINRLTTERYDNIKSDPTNVGAYCYYYYPDCDPACEDAFGNAWN